MRERTLLPRPLRNLILMVISSLVIFLLLSYIDEYDNLVAPFLGG